MSYLKDLNNMNTQLVNMLYEKANVYKELKCDLNKVELYDNDGVNAQMDTKGNIGVLRGLNEWIINYSNGNHEYLETFTSFILAHEIGHRIKKHANKGRNAGLLTAGAAIGLSLAGLGEVAEVGSLAMNHGVLKAYSRSNEYEADKIAIILCYLCGYNIKLIPQFWKDFSQLGHSFDWFSTHPNDKDRLNNMREVIHNIGNEIRKLNVEGQNKNYSRRYNENVIKALNNGEGNMWWNEAGSLKDNTNEILAKGNQKVENKEISEKRHRNTTTITVHGFNHPRWKNSTADIYFKEGYISELGNYGEVKFDIDEDGEVLFKLGGRVKASVKVKNSGVDKVIKPSLTSGFFGANINCDVGKDRNVRKY